MIIPSIVISERSEVPGSYENGSVPLHVSSEQKTVGQDSAEETPSGVCDVRMDV
jgi:hypothetical protein